MYERELCHKAIWNIPKEAVDVWYILEQDRIQQRQAEDLLQSQAQVIELSNKIEALTNLEKSLSIRRALTTDTPQGNANE